MHCWRWKAIVAGILLFSAGITLPVMASQLAGHVTVVAANGKDRAARDARVVVWLKPATPGAELQPADRTPAPHARLIQRNKTFDPHVVAVEVGSLVEFPNRDPFFHNVFSLFNGKRFDLGLYEAGSTRSVHFDRPGICYIFCNIHPQMSAVVVVVDTPFFAVSDEKGDIAVLDVPAGEYQLNVWEEQSTPQVLKELSRKVVVTESNASLGDLRVRESIEPSTAHLNKYGRPYDPQVFSSPAYVQP